MSQVWKCDICNRETGIHIDFSHGTYMEAGRTEKLDLCPTCSDRIRNFTLDLFDQHRAAEKERNAK